ncbi:MAG: sirohydrochlorin cobaltochelatase [Aminivibrio sp.]|jgi:sirohydrochlorin cobaltochelatase
MRKIMWTALLILLTAAGLLAAGAEASEKDKEAVLLVAFGTSEPEARGAIGRIVEVTRKSFPEAEVRLAYTSNIIRRKILREEGLEIDSPLLALAKMQDEGFSSVTVQSLHIIPGEEYHQLSAAVEAFRSIEGKYGFERLSLGAPLLFTLEDYKKTVALLKKKYGPLGEGGGAVVFMGHGTHHWANGAYSQMQALFDHEGLPFVVGVVEDFPGLDMVKKRLSAMRPSRVTLVPFMVVAGDHARNDMADEDDPASWISELRKEGYSVEAVLRGLGDGEGLAELFTEHIREAAGDR